MFGERPTFYRKTLGVVAIAVAIATATAVWIQVADLMAAGEFIWEQYFSYFTIVTVVLNVVALLFGGIAALQSERDSLGYTIVRQSLATYAITAAGVYHLLLRDELMTSDSYVSATSVPMLIFHTYLPIYLTIDWLITPYRAKTSWWSLAAVLTLPAAWITWTLYRGLTTGWFPYRFLDPTTEAGWPGALDYMAGITVFIVAVQLVLLATNRLFHFTKHRTPALA
jgi:hypothetical protein